MDSPSPKLDLRSLTDRELIDIISYLASLASQTDAIDTTLDTLRVITASWNSEMPLSTQERASLISLVEKLKYHLINKDPLREFTEQSLEQRLQEKLDPQHVAGKGLHLGFGSTIVACLLLASLTLLLPLAPKLIDRIVVAVPVFLLFATIANANFYLSSLRNFKKELRHVFIYLCVGILALGVQFLHFVSIPLLGQDQLPLYKYGGLTIIAALGLTAIYVGLRKYATILQLHSRFTNIWLVAGVLIATTGLALGLALGLPWVVPVEHPTAFSFSLASLFALSAVALCGAMVATAILKSVTPAYAHSLRWVQVFTFGVCIGALGYAGALVVVGELSGPSLSAALGVCATPPMLLMLYSGYSFKKETGK